jgi:hypothetical protein
MAELREKWLETSAAPDDGRDDEGRPPGTENGLLRGVELRTQPSGAVAVDPTQSPAQCPVDRPAHVDDDRVG